MPEDKRAWHAGLGGWRGVEDVNSASIGIEIVNGGHDYGLPPYPGEQIEAVIGLCRDILGRNGIEPWDVVGHSDTAPDRKEDPGELFPWKRLAEAGIGLWPQIEARDRTELMRRGASGAPVREVQARLRAIGYSLEADGTYGLFTEAVVRAFQRRYRPEKIDGILDAQTAALIEALAASGRAQGLPDAMALQLARSTVAGAGALALESGEDPGDLRIAVTSPKGTTAAALEVLMDPEDGLVPLIDRAVDAAARRSRELGA